MSDSKKSSTKKDALLKEKSTAKNKSSKTSTKNNNAAKKTTKKKVNTVNKKTTDNEKKNLKVENINKKTSQSKNQKSKNVPKKRSTVVKKTTQKPKEKSVVSVEKLENVIKKEEKKELVNDKTKKDTIDKKVKVLSSKLHDKIFEEVKEEEVLEKEKPKKEKKSINKEKLILSLLLTLILLFALAIILVKCVNRIKRSLKTYEPYQIGEKLVLVDNSIWYVVEDSNKNNATVKLLKETQIDVNGDGKFDDKDKKKFSTSGKLTYDVTDKNSVASYLENDYKSFLNKSIGTVVEIGLLTSKEYVTIRNRMGFGYEWSEGNWLANSNLGIWWINTYQNNKIYAVINRGSYKLYAPTKENYVRPTIVITKDKILKKA